MSTRSRWLFTLIGDDRTGKTTLQRHLVHLLNGRAYAKLPTATIYDVTHPSFERKLRKFFMAGRSYQEIKGRLGRNPTIERYFDEKIDARSMDAVDLGFVSSHLHKQDIQQIILEAHRRFWNICGVFFSNSIVTNAAVNADISSMNGWDARWLIENPQTDNEEKRELQLSAAANAIVQMLIERTRAW